MQKQDEIWCVVQLYSIEVPVNTPKDLLSPHIQNLIDRFSKLFAQPSGKSPARVINHTIPLFTDIQPFRLRP
jgi:hypothetical protein